MKNTLKKHMMYVMSIGFLLLAFCFYPVQKIEARDWGEEYPYGDHQILKFNGKMLHGI